MPSITAPQSQASLAHALRTLLEQRTGESVELVETQLSWVLLTRKLAFKLKKTIRLPFVDYSTVGLRRQCCLDELRLNRRFAPALYRAVLPVTGTPSNPRFGGGGEPIDHVVCMRRFPDGALLSERLGSGRLAAAALERFARHLGQLHRAAPVPGPELQRGWPEQVLQAMLGVMNQLGAHGCEDRIGPLRAWVDDQAWGLWDVWLARRANGFVRECHGDLHLANLVVLGSGVTAFDCVEFDPALRWIDVMSDLAFPVMDLEARGRSDLAFRFLDAYLQSSGDYAGVRVLRFYAVYRALVRALVDATRPEAGRPDYLACAARWANGAAPRLLVTHGVSGSGKSTAALGLLEIAGAVRVRSDVERKRLRGLAPLRPACGSPAGLYDASTTQQTYEQLATSAQAALEGGFPVIVDAAFLRAADRQAFRQLADRLDVPFNILSCGAEEGVLRHRIEARGRLGDDPSDADASVLEHQLADIEPLSFDELDAAIFLPDAPGGIPGVAAAWAKTKRSRVAAQPSCTAAATEHQR